MCYIYRASSHLEQGIGRFWRILKCSRKQPNLENGEVIGGCTGALKLNLKGDTFLTYLGGKGIQLEGEAEVTLLPCLYSGGGCGEGEVWGKAVCGDVQGLLAAIDGYNGFHHLAAASADAEGDALLLGAQETEEMGIGIPGVGGREHLATKDEALGGLFTGVGGIDAGLAKDGANIAFGTEGDGDGASFSGGYLALRIGGGEAAAGEGDLCNPHGLRTFVGEAVMYRIGFRLLLQPREAGLHGVETQLLGLNACQGEEKQKKEKHSNNE